MRILYLDLETAPRDGIDLFLPDPGDAPANYKDEVKIKAYVDEQRRQIKARAALDPDLAQVVALGYAIGDDDVTALTSATTPEPQMLQLAAEVIREADRIIGFNLPGFDLRVLTRRAQLTGAKFPNMELGRYRYDYRITDLQHVLSFGDGPQKGKGLSWYCRLFGIGEGAADTSSGADIGALVAAGDWVAVEQHVRCDVEKTRALAKRMGCVRSREPVTA